MLHDPLNDAMSMIKNAELKGKRECVIRPYSKLIGRVLSVMKDAGYIASFEYEDDGKAGVLKVVLSGNINNCGIIKPRFAVKREELDRFEARYLPAQDFGVLIMTTTHGVITHAKAKEEGIGGKLLAYVY
jgi:small subunit ribosomal protein S8